MKFQEILELIDKVAEKEISSVEIEQAGTKLKIEGKQTHAPVIAAYAPQPQQEAKPLPVPAAPQSEAARAEEKRKEEVRLRKADLVDRGGPERGRALAPGGVG